MLLKSDLSQSCEFWLCFSSSGTAFKPEALAENNTVSQIQKPPGHDSSLYISSAHWAPEAGV